MLNNVWNLVLILLRVSFCFSLRITVLMPSQAEIRPPELLCSLLLLSIWRVSVKDAAKALSFIVATKEACCPITVPHHIPVATNITHITVLQTRVSILSSSGRLSTLVHQYPP
ncbi:hypothetical protein BCR33DRAFT_95997 [Rhizoclosmatium globosum]|uniref:Secreted protein n=1 Tax=Rhizoclosmatium globosum TaxID=329046 RepID=A0A1Y2CLZ2_9FUNG|nr:hypothetical protein BCR33DRAFT_95997 [Rhizoclosmatium globosum]|eukprot:ORY47375.1 hypothetical protein BCR33DRAFT_95997 [Rhizoclosmatium globosum]